MIPYNITDTESQDKIEYFGFMVCLFTGEVEDLHGFFDYKPQHENGGTFGYAKWFANDEKRRDSVREYTIKEIKEIQMKRG